MQHFRGLRRGRADKREREERVSWPRSKEGKVERRLESYMYQGCVRE